MEKAKLDKILRLHKLWLGGKKGGVRADLSGTDLRGADFRGVDLCGADLRGASLRGADIRGANLKGANMDGAIADETTKGYAMRCPAQGAYIAYKRCRDVLIVKLEIPADAKRSSATTNKCRASKAKVLNITGLDGTPAGTDTAYSRYGETFAYRVGETVEVPNFDANRWNECAPGIHHFVTRDEAVEYF